MLGDLAQHLRQLMVVGERPAEATYPPETESCDCIDDEAHDCILRVHGAQKLKTRQFCFKSLKDLIIRLAGEGKQ